MKKFIFFTAFLTTLFASDPQITDITIERSAELSRIHIQTVKSNEEAFESVISLGDRCATKLSIHDYFSEKQGISSDYYTGGGGLFDWMVPFNLAGLSAAIENNLDGCCDENMIVMDMDGGDSAPVDKYGCFFNHIFELCRHPFATSQKSCVTSERHLLTQEFFQKYYPEFREKINYLKIKFLQNKKKTLYICVQSGSSMPHFFSFQNIERLYFALKKMRSDDNFILLIISNQNHFPEEKHPNLNILYRKIEQVSDRLLNYKTFLDEFSFKPLSIDEILKDFDAEIYLKKYADLLAAAQAYTEPGARSEWARNHFINNGYYEGRKHK